MNPQYPQDQATDSRWVRLRRHGLAVLTVLLVVGIAFFERYPPQSNFQLMFQAACWRMAPLTALIWLAYYQILALPTWLIMIVPATLVVAVLRPRAMIFFLLLLILIMILRPRKKSPRKLRGRKR
ncbi:MAG: hypothetical protein ACUVQR_07405 [Thermogutta sp.]